MRNTPAGTKSGRKWFAHLAASVGTANSSATISVRRLPATARMAERSTRESKKDTMRSPPLISSTKGAQAKNRPRAMRSCTAEKRRGFGDFAACMISSIQLRKFRIFTPSGVPGHLGQRRRTRCPPLIWPLLPISHRIDTHRTEPTELLNFDVVRSGGF